MFLWIMDISRGSLEKDSNNSGLAKMAIFNTFTVAELLIELYVALYVHCAGVILLVYFQAKNRYITEKC